MNKKYEILYDDDKYIGASHVYRIRALKDFVTSDDTSVYAGDLGGYIESEDNLSQDGNCWIDETSSVIEKARVKDGVYINRNSTVKESAAVYDNVFAAQSVIGGTSRVSDNASLNKADIKGHSEIGGITTVHNAIVKNSRIYENAYLDFSTKDDVASVISDSLIGGNTHIINVSADIKNSRIEMSDNDRGNSFIYNPERNTSQFLTIKNSQIISSADIVSSRGDMVIDDCNIHCTVPRYSCISNTGDMLKGLAITDMTSIERTDDGKCLVTTFDKYKNFDVDEEIKINMVRAELLDCGTIISSANNGYTKKDTTIKLTDVPGSVIGKTKNGQVSVMLSDESSPTGVGELLISEKRIERRFVHGAPVPNSFNINLGTPQSLYDYKRMSDDGKSHKIHITASDALSKWETGKTYDKPKTQSEMIDELIEQAKNTDVQMGD